MKHLLCVLCLCCPLLLALLSPTSAEPAGLLLGLRTELESPAQPEAFGPEDEFQYFTVWIYPQANGYKYARGPNLLVPRDAGFWEVGSIRHNSKSWVEDQLYAHPVGEPSKLDTVDPSPSSGHISKGITYVGPKAMTVATHSHGYTEGAAHPWNTFNLETVDVDGFTPSFPITTVWGRSAIAIMEDSYHNYMKEFPELSERLEDSTRPTAWGLKRREGTWKVMGLRGHGAEVYRGSSAFFPVNLPITKKVSAHDGLSMTFDEIREKIPGARDAFQGPDGHPIVVLTKTHLHVFRDLHQDKASLLIDLGDKSTAVMVEWALGRSVQRWSESMLEFIGADI